MGWGTERLRPLGNPYGRSGSRWMRGRVLVQTNNISVMGPMSRGYKIEGPEIGLSLAYHTDLNLRVYLKATSGRQSWQRTIKCEAKLVSAPAVGGEVPDENSGTWTDVPNGTVADFGFNLALSPYHLFVSPDDAPTSLEYVSLQTTVWQDPGSWEQPFEVVHELWANAYLSSLESQGGAKTQVLGNSHFQADLGLRRKPFRA